MRQVKAIGKIMRLIALLIVLLHSAANAGVFSTERVQAYPEDWPKLSRISSDCKDVQGTFVDPNAWRWEHEEFPGSPLGSKYGGAREAAWAVFYFSGIDVQSENQKIHSRTFTVSPRSDGSMNVTYIIEGKAVASKTFSKEKISCEQDGLKLTTVERSGVVLDKLPNRGHTIEQATLYRLGDYLYVKTENRTKAVTLYIWPESFVNVSWFRFPAKSQ